MTTIQYREHSIVPASYENSDMPGHWFPLAVVDSPSGDSTRVALQPVRGIAKADADAAAIAEAKRRVAANNL
ncbi:MULTISPECIES: hypothetical protein [Paraburkholderia]|uniref:Uncharacterized protein n=1 Tax=Paraburkholderia podalyriae TaxID=1938811 RepID=A0ABR7Q2A8_9BURK|nr:hypothetical protein [Paraburkholderia podalyriae]MBC8752687.1 hypothetical protein [Paraburkholderia podalyriae]